MEINNNRYKMLMFLGFAKQFQYFILILNFSDTCAT